MSNTFEAFQASKTIKLVYFLADTEFEIEQVDLPHGRYCLTIANDSELSDNLATLERKLYDYALRETCS